MGLAISFVVGTVIGGAVVKWQDMQQNMQQKKTAELESRLAALESKAENNGAGEAAEEVSD